MLRKFKHSTDFGDFSVKYVIYDTLTGKFSQEFKDGDVIPTRGFNITECLNWVDRGFWIEIKEPSCECNCNKLRDYQQERVDDMREYFKKNGIDSQIGAKFMSVDTEQEPIDFSTAQVGDTVRCLLNGDIKVNASIDGDGEFKAGDDWYKKTGKLYIYHKNPCLIGFVDTDGKLCRTRPEPKIDWSRVAIDAPVEVTTGDGVYPRHFSGIAPGGESILFWAEGKTSHTTGNVCCFTNATYKLINTEDK